MLAGPRGRRAATSTRRPTTAWRARSSRARGVRRRGRRRRRAVRPRRLRRALRRARQGARAGSASAAAWPVPYWYGDAGVASRWRSSCSPRRTGLAACFLGAFRNEPSAPPRASRPERSRACSARCSSAARTRRAGPLVVARRERAGPRGARRARRASLPADAGSRRASAARTPSRPSPCSRRRPRRGRSPRRRGAPRGVPPVKRRRNSARDDRARLSGLADVLQVGDLRVEVATRSASTSGSSQSGSPCALAARAQRGDERRGRCR